jgi:uncharacterized protein YegL
MGHFLFVSYLYWEIDDMAGPLIPDVSLIDNSEERVPLVLCLDCSGSMDDGGAIDALNEGLRALDTELKKDVIAAKRVRILLICFGRDDEVWVEGAWTDVRDFVPPVLEANGRTPTGAAVRLAIQMIEDEKSRLRESGVSYKRPLLYIMSDGQPTDEWKGAAQLSRDAEDQNKVSIFPIAVGGDADVDILSAFAHRKAVCLDGLKFKELFLWLSASVKAVSQANKGQAVQMSPTDSWAMTTA